MPKELECENCGAKGCKLWRDYGTFTTHLLCAFCAAEVQGVSIETIREDGTRIGPNGGRTDQIGWCVPAVQDPEDGALWGYTSIPIEDYKLWQDLPLKAGV